MAAAARGNNAAWSDPVIASHQTSALFSDKEQVWADNAASSPFFGNVYVCYAAFRGNGQGSTNQPLDVLTSGDGGGSWSQHQVTPATNNTKSRNGFGRSGCTVRTDSHGVVYVFDFQFGFSPTSAAAGQIQMIRSFDGGAHWERPVNIFTAFDTCDASEPSIGRCVEDGVGGARSDLSPAPSVDIANGAPSGSDASNRLVLTWVDGRDGLNHEHVMFTTSTDRGASWAAPRQVERSGDRGYYSAPAISPNGTDVWLVYNAFEQPFKISTVGPANEATGRPGPARDGERRGGRRLRQLTPRYLRRCARVIAERPRSGVPRRLRVRGGDAQPGVSVWNDVRNAAHCGAVDRFARTSTTRRWPRDTDRRGGGAPWRATRARTPPVALSRRTSSRCARPPSATPTSSGGRAWPRRSPSASPARVTCARARGPNLRTPSASKLPDAQPGIYLDHSGGTARPATDGRQIVEGRAPQGAPLHSLLSRSRVALGAPGRHGAQAVARSPRARRGRLAPRDGRRPRHRHREHPGALAKVAAAISDAGVNIAAATCLGAGDRAELHILVKHAEAARHSLAISHLAVSREREVVVVDVEDRPGVLADLTRRIARAGVDLDLVYVATRNRVVFGAPDLPALRTALDGAS